MKADDADSSCEFDEVLRKLIVVEGGGTGDVGQAD